MSEKKTGLGRGLTSLLGEDISVVSELKNEGKNIKYKSETIKLAKCLSAYSFKFIYGGSSKGLMGSFSNEIIKNNKYLKGEHGKNLRVLLHLMNKDNSLKLLESG